jgi:ABC-type transport system involved in cytochrome bd biosynthesis fused ATPase/permease subunit
MRCLIRTIFLSSIRPAGSLPRLRLGEGASWLALTSFDLAHSYGGDTYALKPMTMTWRQGGAYALLGPSGCGKTHC